jgi:hypothetical protein
MKPKSKSVWTSARKSIPLEIWLVSVPLYGEMCAASTKAAAKRIAKAEAQLVNKYAAWLAKNHGRHPLPYSLPISFSVDGLRGHVACDLYDEHQRIMIEAKSATDRHSIRLAIGQLYDYSYLMQQIRGKNVRRAVLLPSRLSSEFEQFLKSLRIASIWKDGKSFSDNIHDTFR